MLNIRKKKKKKKKTRGKLRRKLKRDEDCKQKKGNITAGNRIVLEFQTLYGPLEGNFLQNYLWRQVICPDSFLKTDGTKSSSVLRVLVKVSL